MSGASRRAPAISANWYSASPDTAPIDTSGSGVRRQASPSGEIASQTSTTTIPAESSMVKAGPSVDAAESPPSPSAQAPSARLAISAAANAAPRHDS